MGCKVQASIGEIHEPFTSPGGEELEYVLGNCRSSGDGGNMTGKSGDHAVFAANLRQLCASETSIADICRDTGINRQQFNKYLAGRSIPSARILRKICLRLGVSENALLSGGESTSQPHASAARAGQFSRELDRLVSVYLPENKSVLRLADSEFGPGAYHSYFPFHDAAGILLRGYVEVWWHKDTLMFTRMTRVQAPGRRNLTLRSRHHGVAIAAKGEISLVARNRMQPFQVTLMNISPSLLLHRFFVGMTLTHSAGPAIACRVVLDRLGEQKSRREALRTCGVVPADHASVPTFVREAMRQDAPRGPTLQLPNVDEILGSAALADL